MFFRLHSSCTYSITPEHIEIRSDVFGRVFKIKGLTVEDAIYLLNCLKTGIKEKSLTDRFLNLETSQSRKFTTLVNFLKEKKLLVTRSSITERKINDSLYDRQIRFFDSFETDEYDGEKFNANLQNKKVVIVGLGAYGTWLALHCARLGIKNIIGIDYDLVELSNLHRQVLYTKSDICLPKAIACKKLISAVDSEIRYEGICKKITSAKDLVPFLDNANLVFNAFGYFLEEDSNSLGSSFITKASVLTQTPMLCMSTNWLGPFYIPGRSACYFCTVNHQEIVPILRCNKKNFRVEKRAFCPILSITCSLAILEAAQFLSGIKQPKSVEGIFAIDPFQINESKFIPIKANPHCIYCSYEKHND